MTEHTKDLFTPWSFRRAGCQILGDQVGPARSKTVATLNISYWGEDEINNAGHLIAAAPDLLEALEEMLRMDRMRYDKNPRAQGFFKENNADVLALVAKAKGQTP